MIRIKHAWAIPLVVATPSSASACGVRTQTTQVSPVTRHRRATRRSTSTPAVTQYRTNYELAWISAEANSVYTSDNKIVDKIRKEAAEKGANAIIVNDFATTGSNAKVIGAAPRRKYC